MQGLSPIDVEYFENKFKTLISNLDKASSLLMPDVYDNEKQQLLQAKQIVENHFTGFNEVLNDCSAGVLFNESVFRETENVINNSIINILWGCQDIISSIMLLDVDLKEYLESLSVADPMVWKMDSLVLTEKKFNLIVDDLETVSKLIMSVLTTLDGYI